MKKNVIRTLLSLILFTVFFMPSYIAAEKIQLKVTKEEANVRVGPSLRSMVVTHVPLEPGQEITFVRKAKPFDNLSFGMGLGPLYASIGVNVETSITEYLSIFGAFGLAQKRNAKFLEFWKRDKAAFAIGARFYPLSLLGKSLWIKPRVGVSYGYNGMYASATYSWGFLAPNEKNQNGINVSFGSDIHIFKALKVNILKNISFDFDVMIPVTRSGYIYTSSGQKIHNLVNNRNIYTSYGIRYNINL